jgi:hypothetical protein
MGGRGKYKQGSRPPGRIEAGKLLAVQFGGGEAKFMGSGLRRFASAVNHRARLGVSAGV